MPTSDRRAATRHKMLRLATSTTAILGHGISYVYVLGDARRTVRVVQSARDENVTGTK